MGLLNYSTRLYSPKGSVYFLHRNAKPISLTLAILGVFTKDGDFNLPACLSESRKEFSSCM
jgi:hypothetical protein